MYMYMYLLNLFLFLVYDLLKILQEEKNKLESIVQKEQLNTIFMSFYNSSKNKSKRG